MIASLRSVRWLTLALAAAVPSPASAQPAPDAAQLEFFEKKIRPLLSAHCYTCHSANTNSKGGLRVDDGNGLLTGGGRGPAIVPGKPDESLLIRAVRYTDGAPKMPPEQPLSDEQIADLVRWIEQGALWPGETDWTPSQPGEEYAQLKRDHWSWQPLVDPPVPDVHDPAWARDPVDRFLLAKLHERGLSPVADADPQDLLRRVTFDLTGLPPTTEEVAAFLHDESPLAFERVVDRLLDSPAFGERWGRHWLDVARFGESTGSARNLPYPHSWRYRDYVIRSFNADKPYDQFLHEQIAGDLIPADTPAAATDHLVATGFLALGVKDVNQRFKVRFIMDNIDEQIDTVSRAILGLTASCARCHDHKFDPIPQTDYYALAGIFHSTDLCAGLRNKMGGGGLDYYDTSLLLPLTPSGAASAVVAAKTCRKQVELAAAQAALKDVQNAQKSDAPDAEALKKQLQAARQTVNRLKAELVALADPALHGPVAMGVRDAETVCDTEIRIRGEAERLGPKVPRGFLSLVDVHDVPGINPQQSGRLELAQWLTSPHNPLTPRVMANRIWQRLFGDGLVRSVDNFGVTGDAPSHPELLDHLAVRFRRGGWSVKALVRSLVLTRAYRLSAEATPRHLDLDPENRLVWRHRPRRLDAEEIRDAMLFVAGNLDPSLRPGSPAQDFKVIELSNTSKDATALLQTAAESVRRSLYLPLLRTLVPASLDVFDFADQGMVTGRRSTTTVAPQALYMLNDPFVRRQAEMLAERIDGEAALSNADRIRRAYELVLGRSPSAAEVAVADNYLTDFAELAARTFDRQPVEVAAAESPAEAASTTNDSGEPLRPSERRAVPAPPALPEEIPQTPPPQAEVQALDAQREAWFSFCQALFGSAEFRYVK